MRDCIDYHRRYMSLMITARGCRNARIQRGLISEAYRWLNAWFDAVEVELSRYVQK